MVLARYETGGSLPTLPTLERLLAACGRDLEIRASQSRPSHRVSSVRGRLGPHADSRREAATILDLPVDVATPDMLKDRVRDEVLNEALPI